MKDNRVKAKMILDYWYNLMFLEQEAYSMTTNEKSIQRNLRRYEKKLEAEKEKAEKEELTDKELSDKNKRQQKKKKQNPILQVIHDLNQNVDIYTQIIERSENYEMNTWGNLTFFLGKVKRQACIEELAKVLADDKFEQVENSSDEIVIASFQCDQHGRYIEGTFSLSPIVWAVSRISHATRDNLSDKLSSDVYKKDIKDFEDEFFEVDSVEDEEDEYEGTRPVFSEDAVDLRKINSIWKALVSDYEDIVGSGTFDKKIALRYQLYKSQEDLLNNEEDTYPVLNTNFYSADLALVKNNIKNASDELVDFICSLSELDKSRTRFDLVNENDHDKLYDEFKQILDVKNYPLGKWPSQYQPVLMQQAAINLSVSDNDSSILKYRKNIFSVNGAPGTGKTTLLKEIIANNVVEKAILLSAYDKADNAFVSHRFEDGIYEDGSYTRYYRSYYSFKNTKINDYGILVASNNNAAVENISKELPMKGKLEADLTENDFGVEEIRSLFLESDGYFSKEATNLLKRSKDSKEKAWGAIAAPLGKKSNIKKYYYNVIKPILKQVQANKSLEENQEKYQKAREDFKDQLQKVQMLYQQLLDNQDVLLTDVKKLQEEGQYLAANSTASKNKLAKELKEINSEIKSVNEQIHQHESLLKENQKNITILAQQINNAHNTIKSLSAQAVTYEAQADQISQSFGFFEKLFDTENGRNKTAQINALNEKAAKLRLNVNQLQDYISNVNKDLSNVKSGKSNNEKKLKKLQKKKKQLESQVSQKQNDILNVDKTVLDAKRKLDRIIKAKDKILQANENAEKEDKFVPFNEAFFNKMISQDEQLSLEAQLSDPWMSKRYDREREKLFYYALEMTKYFILSSKACRTNLHLLGLYWKMEFGDDKKTFAKFSDPDRYCMAPSLLQTIFLLTPAVSSTFASVDSFLRDVHKPGSIGTLIIDEAGQAKPQIAVGALYRSKRAIVVGDPKQVEPITKDDLQILKNAYSEKLYQPYHNESASVQACADLINPFGTYYQNGSDYPDWVGCPLLIHRRCISPMFEISNEISYNNMMKKQTADPAPEIERTLLFKQSKWIQIKGKEETSAKNHFVYEQGQIVCGLIEKAYQMNENPNIYIISPFTTVTKGIAKALTKYFDKADHKLPENANLEYFLRDNIGTIHKFQGKEANEVILVLGCDEKQKGRFCVNTFVKTNIINVAVTRAKYRLYVVGDYDVWKTNENVRIMKETIDKFKETD